MTRIARPPGGSDSSAVDSAPESRPRLPAASSARRSTTSTRGGAPLGRSGRTDVAIAALPDAAHALHGRRRAAEDDRGAGQAGERQRGVAGLQAGRPVALVGRVVLFVDDDQADVGEWRGRRHARPHDHVHTAGTNAPPLVGALALAQPGMQDRYLRVQLDSQPINERRRERDLRHEDERGPAGGDRLGDRFGIDGGLARARDALEQERRRVAGPDGGQDRRQRLRLGRRQLGTLGSGAPPTGPPPRQRPTRPFAYLGHRQAAPDQAGGGAAAVALSRLGGGQAERARRLGGRQVRQ